MLKQLTLALGLLATSCTAAAPALAEMTVWNEEFLIRQGRFGPTTMMITAQCPTGENLRIGTDDPVEAFALLSVINGFTTRGAFLEWLAEYAPTKLDEYLEKINECFAGKAKGA